MHKLLILLITASSALANTYLVSPKDKTFAAYDVRLVPSAPFVRIGAIKVYTGSAPPTKEQADVLFSRDVLSRAKVAKLTAIFNTASPAILAAFAALPEGLTFQFSGVKAGCLSAAKSGDFARAKNIVATCAVPTELAATQAGLVAMFDPLVDLQAAISEASTVEAVAAITLPAPTPSPTPEP